MPIILIIVGIIAAVGLGGYFWESSRNTDAVPTPTPVVTEVTPTPTPTPTEPTPATPDTTPTTPTASATTYKDGTYTADVSYRAPDQLSHPVHVSLTIANDIVTASDVTFGTEVFGTTEIRQKSFATAYKTLVVGQSLSTINLSRVGGSSLTTNAFNEAKAKIAAEAKVS